MAIHSIFLRYFNEVCKTGTIRQAASNLHVAYSAVSRQISNVESELEVKLFERHPSGMNLTPAGELLQQHVARTMVDAKRTFREIQQLNQALDDRITIIGQESIIDRFLPPVLKSLYSKYPDIAIEIKTASGKKLIDHLKDHEADIAIVFDPQAANDIVVATSQKFSVGAVVAKDHELAENNTVSLNECLKYQLVLPDASWPLRDIIDTLTGKSDSDPQVLYSSNSIEFLRKMLANRAYVGFQTIIGIETSIEKGSLVHIPLYDDRPITQIMALCVRAQSLTPLTRQNESRKQAFSCVLKLLSERIAEYARDRA